MTRPTSTLPILPLILTLLIGLIPACNDKTAQPKAEAMDEDAAVTKEDAATLASEEAQAEQDVAQEVEAAEVPAAFDHSVWDAILVAHVDPKTHQVDYAAIKEQEADLDGYLAAVAAADLEGLSERERFAFYVNAYNAYTVKLILEKFPKIKSIRDHKDPWKQARWQVAGETLSLDQIEHEKLRPVFKDPRIHFAVNCAAVGCPPLRAEAYTGQNLDAQLEATTTTTLTSPAYVKTKGGVLYLSSIFDWYGKDFIDPDFKGSKPTVAAYVKAYATPEVQEVIGSKEDAPKVRFLEYDWSLNKKK